MTLEAIRVKGQVESDRQIVVTDPDVKLPRGTVELIILYERPTRTEAVRSALNLPAFDLGRFLGESLRREEIYDDDGR